MTFRSVGIYGVSGGVRVGGRRGSFDTDNKAGKKKETKLTVNYNVSFGRDYSCSLLSALFYWRTIKVSSGYHVLGSIISSRHHGMSPWNQNCQGPGVTAGIQRKIWCPFRSSDTTRGPIELLRSKHCWWHYGGIRPCQQAESFGISIYLSFFRAGFSEGQSWATKQGGQRKFGAEIDAESCLGSYGRRYAFVQQVELTLLAVPLNCI